MKKTFCFLLALLTIVPYFAHAETSVDKLYDAAVELAFNTHNVTLSAEATFTYDSEVFKTMHATYKQDGTRSFLSYMLDTPQLDGSVYTGGYTVYGNGTTAYSCDTYWGNYYNINVINESDTVLQMNNRTKTMLSLGRKLALYAAEGIEENEDGNKVTFKVDDLPLLVDYGIYYLFADYIQDNNYYDIFNLYDYSGDPGLDINFEDYSAVVNEKYKALFGCDAPDMSSEDGTDSAIVTRYNLACNAVDLLIQELQQQYTNGVVYVLKDGSAVHYNTVEEYMRANNQMRIEYWNENKALQNYYKSKYGEDLSQELIDIIIYTPNTELWDAYVFLRNSLDQHYTKLALQQDPNCVTVQVRPDQSLKTYNSFAKSNRTMTQQILTDLSFAELKSLDATVASDNQGYMTSLDGKVALALTATDGSIHQLEISFSCKAEDYGETHVPETFVPADYGLVSLEEFNQLNEQAAGNIEESDDAESLWRQLINDSPATVRFMGKTYETMMDQYKGAEE